jgi:hypothetical protein
MLVKNIVRVTDKLECKLGNFEYDLQLKGPVTLIVGDSGTGKTYLFNMLRKMDVRNPFEKTLCKHRENMRFFNQSDYSEKSLLDAFKRTGQIILIDNTDIILDSIPMVKAMWASQNQFILFGRNAVRLCIPSRYTAVMEQDDNKFTLSYLNIKGE